MAVRTPADKALSDVEKSIKAEDKALEKLQAAQAKHEEAVADANRAARTTKWSASHPDLPEDFDLDEFRRSLEAPFDDVVVDDDDPEALEPEPTVVTEGDAEDDDPFADDE